MSNYPPGFGSAYDLDHVEGPLEEYEIEGECEKCHREGYLIKSVWRSREPMIDCGACEGWFSAGELIEAPHI